jgi:twitching motility protein PilT
MEKMILGASGWAMAAKLCAGGTAPRAEKPASRHGRVLGWTRPARPARFRADPGMNNDTLWLVRLGLDHNLFTLAQATNVRQTLGDSAELMDFAQKLIDDAIVQDIEGLEKIAGLALGKGAKGPPADDPFTEETSAKPAATAGKLVAPSPQFPFETVGTMSDDQVAAGMRKLLKDCARFGASDLHLSTGARPFIRKNRALANISECVLKAPDALRLNVALMAGHQRNIFLEKKDYDYALALSGSDRYRVNLMFHKNGAAGAYRMVPDKVRTLADLGFTKHHETLMKMLSYHNGLILITGPVGSGKTTTLASMVGHLNETRTDHIITVEDPIEVVQPARGCNVTQREVGPHTKSFFTALKGALREDPDVIVIGELRDLETIEMAISASETGHLVIGTMHTSDAATTLNRMLDVFPPSQQTQIRASVAESLRGIVCQRLLPATDGRLALACEILVSNTAIQNLIREGKSAGLRNTMETGVKEGMCLMDNVVFGLWQENRISAEVAQANITKC